MKTRNINISIALALVSTLMLTLVSATVLLFGSVQVGEKTMGKRVTDFSLDDQFERPLSVKFSGKHTIVLIGDRKGLETMQIWEEKFVKEFGDKMQIIRVAYFKGMPFFVPRGLARNEIKEKHPKASVLCDWDGNASAQFGYAQGCHIYFADPNATIRAASNGDYSLERFQLLIESIRTVFQ